jgi:hypothetical protein
MGWNVRGLTHGALLADVAVTIAYIHTSGFIPATTPRNDSILVYTGDGPDDYKIATLRQRPSVGASVRPVWCIIT